ncbi:NAD(P)H-binding protein [Hahella aquimaris]|uniref:NAD(P)H-binding protein n=1 Tax=Hahella sp. HNIBRBA332 TaxID=3015983 RepID=UPI00273AC00C|nr:NAD(P)H-binding protein [Hahella sp. HNIBRBA332]WLQ15263.1 NAD(P)H-binding protein [Hahella sp. HNIBRBA332]
MVDGKRSALILGASGLVGGLCLRRILASACYEQVTAVVRRPLEVESEKLAQRVVNFDRLEQELRDIRADDVFCCLGSTMKKAGSQEAFSRVDYAYPAAAARAMKRNGSSHFLLVSALGASEKSLFFYNRVKGKAERAVLEEDFPFVTIFRPSLLLGERHESRFLEGVGVKAAAWLSPVMQGPLRKYAGLEANKLACRMVREAEQALTSSRSSVLTLESDSLQRSL